MSLRECAPINIRVMNKEEIEIFEKTHAQLLGFYEETAVLVKKNPNDQMSKFKLQLINKVLTTANEIVANIKPFEDFNQFDIDGDIPFNSDVAMILGQYIKCFELIKKDNTHKDFGKWYWDEDGDKKKSTIRTSAPVMLSK